MALLDCAINKKCCTVDGGRGICPLFSSPPRAICQLKSPPPPGNLPSKAKKMLIPGGQPGGAWAQVELTDALMAGRHRCTSHGGVTLSTGWLCQKWKLLDVLGTHLHKKRSCLWAFQFFNGVSWGGGVGGHFGQFLLVMCCPSLRAPTILQSIVWPIIDPILVTFAQM